MPPPSLSTTTTTRSSRARPHRGGRCESCRKARSPISSAVGPAGRRRPRRRPWTPRRRCRWRRGWRGRVTGRPGRTYHSRSRIGIDDDTTSAASVGQRRRPAPGRRRARSGRARRRATRVDRRLRPRRPPRSQRGAPRAAVDRRRRSSSSAAHAREQLAAGRPAARPTAVPCGSIQRAGPGDDDLGGAAGRRPTPRRPATPAGRPGAARPPGAGRRQRGDAQQGVGARDDARRARPTPGLRGGEHRPAERGRRPRAGRRRRPSRARPRSRPRRPARSSATLIDRRRPVAGSAGARPSGPVRPAAAAGSSPARADQRLPEREVEVHRARRAARWPRRRPGRPVGRQRSRAAAVGHARRVEPAHGPAEEVGLVDGLRGAHVDAARAAGRRCTRAAARRPGRPPPRPGAARPRPCRWW